MTGNEYITIPWQTSSYDGMVPDTIEFKIRVAPNSGDMDIFTIGSDNVKLELKNTTEEFGQFILKIGNEVISSSVKSYYNNEFYSIMVKRSLENDDSNAPQNYYLSIRNHDDYINRIILSEDIVLSTSSSTENDAYTNIPSTFYLGGKNDSTQKFKGAFDEFRLWAEPLTEETFDFHTKYSAATNGNTITSSLSSLAFRLSFNEAYNLSASAHLINDAFNTSSYGEATASAFNFEDKPNFPYNFSDFERSNIVEHKLIAADGQNKKIRIEHNYIIPFDSGSTTIYPLKGNYVISDYAPPGEIGEFDNAPPDIDTLLIGFTPVSFTNRDIIAFYGNNDILSNYGDFNNLYESSYPKNNFIINTYWNNTKNKISFNEYLKYIRTYNRTLFDVVKELIPAKVNSILGTTYEQNILRRNRVKLLSPEVATNYKQHLFYINQNDYTLDDIVVNDLQSIGEISPIKKQIPIALHEDLQCSVKSYNFVPQSFDEMNGGAFEFKLNEYNLIAYNDRYINRQRTNTDRFRNISNSTKNSSLTTADRGPAVVIKSSSPKKLIVNYADNPKLIVKN